MAMLGHTLYYGSQADEARQLAAEGNRDDLPHRRSGSRIRRDSGNRLSALAATQPGSETPGLRNGCWKLPSVSTIMN